MFSLNKVFSATFSFLTALSTASAAIAAPSFPPLEEGQKSVMQCDIVERIPEAEESFRDGIPLGTLQIIQNVNRTDIPFELRYIFTEAAQHEYDFSTDDRFPSEVGIIRAEDLIISDKADKTAEELEADATKASYKELLDYFQGMANVPASKDLYGYLTFADAQEMSFAVAYLTVEGKFLGLSGVIYQSFRFSCQSKAPVELPPAKTEAPVKDESGDKAPAPSPAPVPVSE